MHSLPQRPLGGTLASILRWRVAYKFVPVLYCEMLYDLYPVISNPKLAMSAKCALRDLSWNADEGLAEWHSAERQGKSTVSQQQQVRFAVSSIGKLSSRISVSLSVCVQCVGEQVRIPVPPFSISRSMIARKLYISYCLSLKVTRVYNLEANWRSLSKSGEDSATSSCMTTMLQCV